MEESKKTGRPARILMAGERFGRLTATGENDVVMGRNWSEMVCECGEVKWIRTKNLIRGLVHSCGCLRRENMENARSYRKGGKNYKG